MSTGNKVAVLTSDKKLYNKSLEWWLKIMTLMPRLDHD